MDTVTTMYGDLRKSFRTTTLHVAVKAEHVCHARQSPHGLHRITQRRVVLEVGFLRPCGKALKVDVLF